MNARSTAHLTAIPGTQAIIAWHTSEDIQAIRHNDEECLYVDGVFVPMPSTHHTPVQQVVNYCRAGKRDQKRLRAHWMDLAEPHYADPQPNDGPARRALMFPGLGNRKIIGG